MARSKRIKIQGRKYTAGLLEREFGITARTAKDWIRKGAKWVKENSIRYRQIPEESAIKQWSDYREISMSIYRWLEVHGYLTGDPGAFGSSPRFREIWDKPFSGPGYIYLIYRAVYGEDEHYATHIEEAPFGPDMLGSQRRQSTFYNVLENLEDRLDRELSQGRLDEYQIKYVFSMLPKSQSL